MYIRKVSQNELDYLSEYLYTSEGKVYCKKPYGVSKNAKVVGEEVGWVNTQGYEQIFFRGKSYMLHRVVYYLHYGIYPTGEIDHINGVVLDNRPENLRLSCRKSNMKSFQKPRNGGGSTYRGVTFYKANSRWRARIKCDGKEYYLGYFDTEHEAAEAYNKKAKELGFSDEALNKIVAFTREGMM